MKNNSLYKLVVDKTTDYLGPSANRFIDRQIVGHLDMSPEKIQADDLNQVIKWIKPAIALLTDDPKSVDRYIASLKKLVSSYQKASI